VVLQGQPAPGTGGGFSLFSPSIHLNDSGAVIFWAKISGGNTGFGIFLFSRGEILPIALEGQIAPGTGGGRFTYFPGWILNNAGDVLFRAGISDGRGRVFLFSKGEISVLDFPDRPIPGTDVQPFFEGIGSMNDAGDIAYVASGRILVYSKGTITLIASPPSDGPYLLLSRPSLNNRGEIAFINSFDTRFPEGVVDIGISLFSNGKTFSIASPGRSYLDAKINDSGAIAFVQCIQGACSIHLYKDGVTSTIAPPLLITRFAPELNNSGVVVYIEGSFFNGDMTSGGIRIFDGTKLVGINGGEAPGTGGGKFSGFDRPVLNNFGTLAFGASVTGGTASSGIFLANSTGLQRPRRRP
jgi:hypothetical protein